MTRTPTVALAVVTAFLTPALAKRAIDADQAGGGR